MNEAIQQALAIIARRKELAKDGNGLMQSTEYENIEKLLLGERDSEEPKSAIGPCAVKGQAERIVAAAILQDGVVYTGTRHGLIIRDIVIMTGTKPVTGQQGFVTSKGQFVSREIAGEIAMRSSQVRHLKYSRTQLFSEDVWDIPAPSLEPKGTSADNASSKP